VNSLPAGEAKREPSAPFAGTAQVWSCGGGTQSGAIAELIRLGKLPVPDFAFMTNTGRERSSTWPFVDGFIRPALASEHSNSVGDITLRSSALHRAEPLG